MVRRGTLVFAVCVLVTTTGCLGFITGGESLYFEAEEAAVDSETVDATGYQEFRDDAENLTQEFTVAGQTREVTVRNQVHGYNRSVELGPLGERDLARFVVYSTPAVSIAGQELNPVGGWSNRRLVEELSSSYDNLGGVEFEQNRSVRALGSSRTVSTFSATATVAGQETDVRVHITKFRHGDDFVVAVSVHPQRLDEWDRVRQLIGGLDHADG